MFRINIIAVGKNKEYWVDGAVEHYSTLLKKYAETAMIYIPDIKQSKNLTETELRRAEAIFIQRNLKADYHIALSNAGKSFDSEKFAKYIEGIMLKSGSCDFVIGGIYGLDKTIVDLCNDSVSLSPMTMSHQLVRPVLLEQLYRSFSIISGGKYHK